MRKHWILGIALTVLLGAGSLYATDYYVKNDGDDTKAGTSDALAWKTIAKVNGESFSGDDIIYFKRGDTWREQLTVPDSGTSGHPITFGAYGTGAKPIINGADLLSSWTPEVVGTLDLTADANCRAYWYFEEASGIRYDETANNNDLAATGTPTQSADEKQGTYSVGMDSANYLSIANANIAANFPVKAVTSAFSIGGWVKFTTLPNDWDLVFFYANNWDNGITLYYEANKFYYKAFTADGAGPALEASDGGSAIALNTWIHVVMRWDGTTMSLVVDGTADSHTAALADLKETTSNLSFISNSGAILYDEWFAFDRLLTTTEITGIINDGLIGDNFTSYYATATVEPNMVWEDAAEYTLAVSKALMVAGNWWWDAGNTRVYVRCTEDANPSTKTIEASQRDRCINFNSKSYITIDSLNCKYANAVGIWLTGANGIIKNTTVLGVHNSSAGHGILITASDALIDNNTVSYCRWGIAVYASGTIVDSTLIQNNTVSYIEVAGITANSTVDGTYTNTIYQNNTVHHCAQTVATGIGISFTANNGDGSGNIARYNLSYSTPGTGIGCEYDTADVALYYNIVYGCGISGIAVMGSDGTDVNNNILYNNQLVTPDSELYIGIDGGAGVSSNTTAKNNIIYGAAGVTLVNVGATSQTGNDTDHNCFYGGSATPFKIGASSYNFADYKTQSSQDANSLNTDPLMIDPANGDFRIPTNSPCKDAGTDVSLTKDYLGITIPQGPAPDIGAYEYSSPVKLKAGAKINPKSGGKVKIK